MFRSRRGFTLLEVLVAGSVLITILVATSLFFSEQARISQRSQELSSLQNRARMTMHVLTNDLVLSGANEYVGEDGLTATPSDATVPSYPIGSCYLTEDDDTSSTDQGPCLMIDPPADLSVSPTGFRLSTTYVNNLRALNISCMEIGYQLLDGDRLVRDERQCGTFANVMTSSTIRQANVFADGIVAVDVQLQCSNRDIVSEFPHPTDCEVGVAYPRSAVVSVVARTLRPMDGPTQSFELPSGATVSCPDGFRCTQTTEEVTLPNLKDR